MKKQHKKNKILYITYDGLIEPLGRSQIYEYLKKLSIYHDYYLISFEKKSDLKEYKISTKLKYKFNIINVKWKKFLYVKKKNIFKIFYNFIFCFFYIFFLLISKNIKIIHIRSYIPGIIILPLLYVFKIKLIFDIRGFLPNEKIDRENWDPGSIKINFLKFIERKLINKSNYIITLTNESKKIIIDNYKYKHNKIEVIPTCVNIDNFKYINKKYEHKINFCFLGSLNKAYDFIEMTNFVHNISKINKNYFFYFYIKDNNNYLFNLLQDKNINKNRYLIKFINTDDVSKYLDNIDFGFFFLKKNTSIKASFPTKIAEYLSKGIPIVCNNFNSDIEEIISNKQLGILIDYKNIDYDKLTNKINILVNNENINKICREYAENNLSINYGCNKYLEVYDKI